MLKYITESQFSYESFGVLFFTKTCKKTKEWPVIVIAHSLQSFAREIHILNHRALGLGYLWKTDNAGLPLYLLCLILFPVLPVYVCSLTKSSAMRACHQ